MNKKKWYHSRTLWFNGLTLLTGGLMLAATAVTSDGEPLLAPRVAAWLALVIVPTVNVALRIVTTTGVE